MTKTFSAKKIISAIVVLSVLLCSMAVYGTVSTNAAAKSVSLYSTNLIFQKYGAGTYEVYVKTDGATNHQNVYVHYHDYGDKAWDDAKATEFATLDDGSIIWKATVVSHQLKFAIKYVADGVTYWDNNGSKDYTLEDTGCAPIYSKRLGYNYGSGVKINAVLQNYAYEKDVKVRYTTDNWASYNDAPLSYVNTKADGTETWTVTLNVDKAQLDGFEYALSYTVDGETYWDNNFGKNYDRYFYIFK